MATPMGIFKLPAEITESIIDCLYDDRDALKNCALTHPSWLARSRYHLHKSVSLDNSTVSQKLSGYYATGAAAYIQNLTLIAPPQPYGHHRRGSISTASKPLWQIASRFVKISKLTLVFFNWRGAHKSYDRLAEITQHVTDLTLVISSFSDVADFLSFLRIFPQLTKLSVSTLTFGCASTWGTGYTLHPDGENLRGFLDGTVAPQLRSLRFANSHPCPVLSEQLGKWLCALPRQVVAKSGLAWTGAGSIHGLIESLHGLGANLAHLELDVASASQLAFGDENGLRTNTALETLTLRDLHYLAREEVQWLLVLLSQIASSAFRKLEFNCTSSSFDGVDEHSVELLDELLATPAYAHLEEVVLTFAFTSRQNDLEGTVKHGLRRLGERGILHANFPAYTVSGTK